MAWSGSLCNFDVLVYMERPGLFRYSPFVDFDGHSADALYTPQIREEDLITNLLIDCIHENRGLKDSATGEGSMAFD
jgi:hypothetical protein